MAPAKIARTNPCHDTGAQNGRGKHGISSARRMIVINIMMNVNVINLQLSLLS